LGWVATAASFWLLWGRQACRGDRPAVLLVVAAQLRVLVDALSLAPLVRSGEAWNVPPWRRLLSDLGVVDLFAYHGWVTYTPLLAAATVAAAALTSSFSGTRPHPR